MSSNTPCSVKVVGVIPRPVGTGAARPLTVRCRLLERFRIGGGERGVQLGRRLRPPQPLADLDLAKQGGQGRQHLQMLVDGIGGHHQRADDVDWRAVDRIEIHTLLEADQRAADVIDILEAAVRNGDAVAEAGTAKALARHQTVEYLGFSRRSAARRDETAHQLQRARLAGGTQPITDALRRDELTDMHSRRSPASTWRPTERCGCAALLDHVDVAATVIRIFFFLLLVLTVELVDEHVDCRVHVLGLGRGEYRAAAQIDGGLRLLPQLLHAQYHMHIAYMIEMTRQAFHLLGNVLPQCRGDLHMMTGELDLHYGVPLVFLSLNQLFSFVGGRDRHGLAVFRHRAARDIDALVTENRGDLAVAERLAMILGGDQLFDQRADRSRGTHAAGRGADMAGKEIFEFEDAARRPHVFFGGDARDGGLVHAHFFRHVVQHQRLHRFFAVFEKTALALDDAGRHLEQRFVAALQALHEPARLLQLAFEIGVVVFAVGAADQAGVMIDDAQPWHRLLVELDAPSVLVFAHDHVRDHVFGLRLHHRAARARIEGLHEFDHALQIGFVEAHAPQYLRVVAAAEQGNVFAHQLLGLGEPFGIGRQLLQLDQ